MRFDYPTATMQIWVDELLDVTSQFGAGTDEISDDWQIEIGRNWDQAGYISSMTWHFDEVVPIERLNLEGSFIVEHVGWSFSRDAVTDMQAASWISTSAVHFSGLRHSRVTGLTVRHVGSMGLWIEGGSENISVSNALITDVGAGGTSKKRVPKRINNVFIGGSPHIACPFFFT